LGVPGFWSFQGRKRWLQRARDTESYRIREIREMGTQDRVDEAGIVESCASARERRHKASRKPPEEAGDLGK
jgi:sarcosine oxidase delta subunit